ncbi:cellulose biosynthesis cyclic di-GMP-binding regulatory protein BcsB [uncultured Pedobacter sp.]|uniref:cellulose biosynthesis cyclic di-GMP-binding regulatory protein BcsB n=1 Tax=uncultured Pedobacter sp. TaxID=246139 RepID=UPI0025EEAB4C|nr:cellulose biosynthesis cyclic di-GMP-binding regulatory protein BcsB [uncultured Pedobacter sp.]
MKKLLIVFALFISYIPGFAQKSFESYGYQAQLIRGTEGQSIYYVRVLPSQQMDKSTIIIHFQASKILNTAKSFIHILVNDMPAMSSKFQTDSINRLVVPISKSNNSTSDFLKITVKSQLMIGDDVCQDDNHAGLWLNILPSSTIYWAKNKLYGPSSVNLSNTLFSKKAIVYPNDISAAELQTVALTYAKLLRSGTDRIDLYPISRMPQGLDNFIAIGLMHKLKPKFGSKLNFAPKKGQGILYLNKEPDTTKSGLLRQILFVTAADVAGMSKATDALLTPGILGSSFQDILKVDRAAYKPLEKKTRLNLSDLEDNNNLMTGTGSLNHDYRFKTSVFSTLPAALNCQFEIKFSGLEQKDRGYFNVYLNDILLTSRQLNESGTLQVSASVNRYQIKKFNTLRTEFVFYPASGLCKGNFQHFIGQVDASKSFIEVADNLEEKQVSFYSYPDVFQQGTAILVAKNMLSYAVKAICELAYQLNDHPSNEIVYRPVIDFSNNAAKYKGRNIVLITDRQDRLLSNFKEMPLQYRTDFTIYDEQPGEAIYKLSSPEAAAISQIFKDQDYPLVLSVTALPDHAATVLLANSILDLNEQLNLLSGNTMINSKDSHLIFNLERSSNNIVYQGDGNGRWQTLWFKYKLLLLAGVLFLIFLAYLYVRSKVNKSQKIVTQ